MSTTAGHTFGISGFCDCGKRWMDVRTATRECIGKVGYAHSSYLSESEYIEIEKKREAEAEACWNAVSAVAGVGR